MHIKQNELHFYRTGLFVILGSLLLIVFIVLFAGGDWFHHPIYMESYFDESVQGLSEGSPVKYRGVAVGQVQSISFIGDQYHSDQIIQNQSIARYVYVRMALKTVSFLGGANRSTQQKLQAAIHSGLRVHLAPAGLTGNSYLELDFSAPDSHLLAIKWKPESYYIPSRPSTLMTITSSLSSLFSNLKTIPFKELFQNITRTAHSARETFDRFSGLMNTQSHNIAVSLDNVRSISSNLRLITENIGTYPSGFLRTKLQQFGGGS